MCKHGTLMNMPHITKEKRKLEIHIEENQNLSYYKLGKGLEVNLNKFKGEMVKVMFWLMKVVQSTFNVPCNYHTLCTMQLN